MNINRICGIILAGFSCLIAAGPAWAAVGFDAGQSMDINEFLSEARARKAPDAPQPVPVDRTGKRRAWDAAGREADIAQARNLREIVARSAVQGCAPDNWIHVDARGVVCKHPDVLGGRTESAFVENILIPAAALAGRGYAVVSERDDEEGNGFLTVKDGRRIGRKSIYVIIEREQIKRAQADVHRIGSIRATEQAGSKHENYSK